MSVYLLLFFEFFKTGLFAIGGGLATIPYLRVIAEKYTWFSLDELTEMIAVSESTPGPIGVNMATYAGFRAGSVLGGIVATLGIICPAIIIVCIISRFFIAFKEKKAVKNVMYGISPCVAALIASAMSKIFVNSLFDTSRATDILSFFTSVRIIPIILFISFFLLFMKFKKLHPVVFILAGAVAGIIFKL